MTRSKCIYVGALALMTVPADAADLGKALTRPITGSFTSAKSIFDIERCIVLLDNRGLPFVYRQPDRPNDALIAFSLGIVVTTVITLHQEGATTHVETRNLTGIVGGVGRKLPSGFEGCL